MIRIKCKALCIAMVQKDEKQIVTYGVIDMFKIFRHYVVKRQKRKPIGGKKNLKNFQSSTSTKDEVYVE